MDASKIKFKPAENVVEMKKVRWMLVFALMDVGKRCSFPFSTRSKALEVMDSFDPKYCVLKRLEKEPELMHRQLWKKFTDLTPEQIIERIEEIRNEARNPPKGRA